MTTPRRRSTRATAGDVRLDWTGRSATAAEKKPKTAPFCGNTALCKITEDLVFTDPYRIVKLNRWTTPQLDGIAAEFRADAAAKVAAQELKWAFLTRAEALVHGDLHTGSIMVTATDSREGQAGLYPDHAA